MYVREVQDRALNFAVSGMLWNRSLVMQDQETDTLWSQILGEAMQGELQGAKLEMLPATVTSWAQWKDRFPDTTVLDLPRTSDEYRTAFYKDPSQFVLGLAVGGDAMAWPFERLMAEPVVNDEHAGVALVVVFDAASKSAVAFDRRMDREILTFEQRDGKLLDRETGTEWDPLHGLAIRGELEGQLLDSVLAICSFTKAWVTFYPDTKGLTQEQKAKAMDSGRRSPRGRRGGE